jgi:hypothetical protein
MLKQNTTHSEWPGCNEYEHNINRFSSLVSADSAPDKVTHHLDYRFPRKETIGFIDIKAYPVLANPIVWNWSGVVWN